VQRKVVPVEEWLPPVFDLEGRALAADNRSELAGANPHPDRTPPTGTHAAISEEGWFDPLLVDTDRLPPVSEYEPVHVAHSRALLPWAAGFHWAQERMPDSVTSEDDAISQRTGRASTDTCPRKPMKTARSSRCSTANSHWARSIAAIEDLVLAAVDLWTWTHRQRFHVETIRRDTPKVGRNDPCPCGSGKKFKACHGAEQCAYNCCLTCISKAKPSSRCRIRAELLVLAGDIDATLAWLRALCRLAGARAGGGGNHEFDGRELDAAWPALHEHCARCGITLLERDSRVLTARTDGACASSAPCAGAI